jgi:hypothetical protein
MFDSWMECIFALIPQHTKQLSQQNTRSSFCQSYAVRWYTFANALSARKHS